ncbi:RNA polymerase sigma factor [Halarcobacter anaerophilus]|uniref:RNA polymerase sigma factor n=1 Tax=Halarcobacter anaerophilus TaxID=877500 RepID=UPI0005CB3FC7|nr:RNA polymerase sigma factor [Halarcobacter anaerophilus]
MLHYYKELQNFVQRMVGNREYATEIVQETYTKALEVDSKIIINNERAFLYKIAKNIVIDDSRKNSKFQKVIFEEEEYTIPKEEQPEEQILNILKENLIKEAIEKLPSRSKQAFVLHFIKGFTRQQIAQKMGISTNAAQKHITRATQKIKEQISLQDWDINE